MKNIASSRASLTVGAFLLVTAAALVVAFVVPTRTQMTIWFEASGFYVIFAAYFLLALAWLRDLAEEPTRLFTSQAARETWAPLAAALGLMVLATLASPPTFRILNDELYMLGTSLGMYNNHGLLMPEEGLLNYCGYTTFEVRLDKRPMAWPFLVYVGHALRGFHPNNAFLANFVVSTLCLFSLQRLLRRWFGSVVGWVGMLLLGATPIFVLWATSGGFEILNILFLILSFLFLDRFLERRSARSFELLVATLVILAQCRYESMVFSVLMFAAAVWARTSSRPATSRPTQPGPWRFCVGRSPSWACCPSPSGWRWQGWSGGRGRRSRPGPSASGVCKYWPGPRCWAFWACRSSPGPTTWATRV